MNILIGSRALNHWDKSVPIRNTTDWDIITTENLNIPNFEQHDPTILLNDQFDAYVSDSIIEINGYKLHVMSLGGLAIIKRSHLWRDLGFGKHITHYHRHLASHLPTDKPSMELLQQRIVATKKRFPQGHPSLKCSPKEFFDDYVTKKYDHDFVHELVAFEAVPMYTKLLSSTDSVWCDSDKWNSLTYSQKCMTVCEETMVIAIERFLVPNDWNYPPKLAYMKALDKVCTTLTSGWFRDFAIGNYPQIVDMYNADRMLNCRTKLEASLI